MSGWDEMFPENICQNWEAWESNLKDLKKICTRRSIKPDHLDTVKEATVYHFSDVSMKAMHNQPTYR